MSNPIDRTALVRRHTVRIDHIDPRSPLSVGNGEFAFTADVTGLQSLPSHYPVGPRQPGLPDGTMLGTQSQWGWHTSPAPETYRLDDSIVSYETSRGPVGYVDMTGGVVDGTERGTTDRDLWLRSNPHRLNLGQIGFVRRQDQDHISLDAASITAIDQRLDLFTAILSSTFAVDGEPVHTITACDPELDALTLEVTTHAALAIRIDFPYGNEAWHNAADWDQPQAHTTTLTGPSDAPTSEAEPGVWHLVRILDDTRYDVCVRSEAPLKQTAAHSFVVDLAKGTTKLTVLFRDGRNSQGSDPQRTQAAPFLPGHAEILRRSAEAWERFWNRGGAVDFSATTDPRAHEIERRTVLSQYLTAINCAGSAPPQETGLVCNSWRGRFHLEMHWWHSAHFAQWGRSDLLLRSLRWYHGALQVARGIAHRQGYAGARWPKQVGPDARESPSGIGPFLVWQQPHVIYLAELAYRADPDPAVLEEFAEIVFATAEFMADFAVQSGDSFTLEPPLIPAQESYGGMRREVRAPAFEQVYWHWALQVAQQWRDRLNLPGHKSWNAVGRGMKPPHIHHGTYSALPTPPWTIRKDHPSTLCALGFLPNTPLVDAGVMDATLASVLADWDWDSAWGWDFPTIAMTATRLGKPEIAVDALVSAENKNTFVASGHNWQASSLPTYLPGNGGLLSAVALMAAGSDSGPEQSGFPPGWIVRHEGLIPAP